jgi:hypothetical protein
LNLSDDRSARPQPSMQRTAKPHSRGSSDADNVIRLEGNDRGDIGDEVWNLEDQFSGIGVLKEFAADAQFNYSWQESGKVCVLRGFLKSDQFGSRCGQPLRCQQQVVEFAVAASAA